METRKLQLYVTERQYRLLKQWAGEGGSIAGIVRELIDGASQRTDAEADVFYRHVMADKPGSGEPYDAAEAKRELYERPH